MILCNISIDVFIPLDKRQALCYNNLKPRLLSKMKGCILLGKSQTTKQEIMRVTKDLIRKKGYAQVTMNDVTQASGMSAGGLYYHYRTVEEIVSDIFQTEIGKVWENIGRPESEDVLFETIGAYFRNEKNELLDYKNSLEWIMTEYYFSFPREQREKMLREKHEHTAMMFRTVLERFISSSELELLTNSICVELLGLTMFSMTGMIDEKLIDTSFEKILAEIPQKIAEHQKEKKHENT